MQPIISGREGNRVRIEVTIDLSGSMLEAEESILRGVNAVGDAATAEALKRFDADGDPIAIGDAKWYSKGKLPKTYNTPYGVISVERPRSAKSSTSSITITSRSKRSRRSSARRRA